MILLTRLEMDLLELLREDCRLPLEKLAVMLGSTTTEVAELYKTDPQAAIKEARQISIDFFNYAKTATWIPADTWEFTHHDDGTGPDVMLGQGSTQVVNLALRDAVVDLSQFEGFDEMLEKLLSDALQ